MDDLKRTIVIMAKCNVVIYVRRQIIKRGGDFHFEILLSE